LGNQALRARLELLKSGDAFKIGFSFPFSKVAAEDEAEWLIEGVATSEVLDQQGEIVTFEAAEKAFANFAGNIREQHDPYKAVGKAVKVIADPEKKQIIVRSMISKGAPETWRKIQDGALRGYSISGQRLRSQILENGIRRTTELKLTELSVCDTPANPQAMFSLVKLSGGRALASVLLARDGEEKTLCAALAIERVATVLAAGARPLPTEVSGALAELAQAAGTPAVSCDSTQTRDFAVEGPVWAGQLKSLAAGLRASPGDADRIKLAKAAELVLLELVHNGRRATGQLVSAQKLYECAASALAKLQAAPSSRFTQDYDTLAANIFTLASMRKAEGVEVKGPLTLDELREMEGRLTMSLSTWNENRLPQNGKEYEVLSRTYIKVASMRKRAEALAVRFGRM
jgi:hypothetical protein